MEHPFLTPHKSGVTIAVHLTPNARKTCVNTETKRTDRAEIRVAAPPDKGRANKTLIAFLSEIFGIPSSRISIIRGASSRDKVLLLEGMDMEDGGSGVCKSTHGPNMSIFMGRVISNEERNLSRLQVIRKIQTDSLIFGILRDRGRCLVCYKQWMNRMIDVRLYSLDRLKELVHIFFLKLRLGFADNFNGLPVAFSLTPNIYLDVFVMTNFQKTSF